MKLEPIGRKPVEMSVRAVAEMFWIYHFASNSELRDERIRAERGDLRDASLLIHEALNSDSDFDELIVELISVLEEVYPGARDEGLAALAAGPIEDRWNGGDTEILQRLRLRGVPPQTITQIDEGIWKLDSTPPRPRRKPRAARNAQ